MRALRVDKMTLAALEATLRLAEDAGHAVDRIPLWAMIAAPLDELSARAEAMAAVLRSEMGLDARGGAVRGLHRRRQRPDPGDPVRGRRGLPAVPVPDREGSEAAWAEALRLGDPPVVGRVQKGRVLLDLRTVARDQEPRLLDAVRRVCQDRRLPRKADGGRRRNGSAAVRAGDGIRSSGQRGRA